LAAQAANAQVQLPLLGVGGGLAFSPATLTGLTVWYDPSDSTTVFTDTGCTSPATNGSSLRCIKDKSTNGYNGIDSDTTPPLLTQSGSQWYIDFSNATATSGFALGTGAGGIFQNRPYGVIQMAVQQTTNLGQMVVWFSTGTNAAAPRSSCATDYGGTGWGWRGKTLDADSAINVYVGTDSAAVTAVRCDARYVAGTANIYINNVAGPSGTLGTAGNTSNTAGQNNSMGVIAGFGSNFTGKLYGLIITTPSSAPAATDLTNTDTWLCAKAGISC
jgi:hypothetical protein